MRPELNIDLGELPNEPEELYSLAHRVNVACGGHAGDQASIERACALAQAANAKVGAHVSYPDRAHFGRIRIEISDEALRQSISEQCLRLKGACHRVWHLKPHGALYHAANDSEELATLVIETPCRVLGRLEIVGPPGGQLEHVARKDRLPFLAEGFADRGYSSDGRLLPRGTPGALLETAAEAAGQTRRLLAQSRFQTLCVHSDTPNAVAIARAVRAVLDEPQ